MQIANSGWLCCVYVFIYIPSVQLCTHHCREAQIPQFTAVFYEYIFLSVVTFNSLSPSSDILRMDSTNGDALYVRGLCLYYEDCIDKAVQFFVQALRMAPDHEKARLACRVSNLVLELFLTFAD